jgi:hypothetical protein
MIVRSAVVILFALSLGASACVEDDSSFYIKGMRHPEAKCATPAPGGTTWVGTGHLDVSMKLGYLAFPEVMNALGSSTAIQPSQPETNILQLRGYRISLDMGEIPGSFPAELTNSTYPTSGTIAPNGAMVGPIEVIENPLAAQLATVVPKGVERTIFASIRAVAQTMGNEKESGVFVFPVVICNGCLVEFLPTCPLAEDKAKYKSNLCGLPQDGQVTCCTEAATGNILCLGQ